jgi:RNA polymerase sigma-70 factor (ECF subfamily)
MKGPQATGIPDSAAEAPASSSESLDASAPDGSGVVVGRPEGALPIGARDPRDELPEHLGALRAFAISLTRNVAAADDLVQDTIVKAWTNLDKFQPGSNLRAWLFTILRNTFYSDKRKTRREVADPEGLYAAALCEKPSHDGRLALADFRRAFDRLSPEHREVLILVGASGFAYEEAAMMMGVAVGTVKSRANRARARLAEMLGLEEGEEILSGVDGATLAVLGRSGVRAA